jgi:hypothetical protein
MNDPQRSAEETIRQIAAEHNLVYVHDGYAQLAHDIDQVFGDGVQLDEVQQLIVAIGRANIMDGQELTVLHARYLQEHRKPKTEGTEKEKDCGYKIDDGTGSFVLRLHDGTLRLNHATLIETLGGRDAWIDAHIDGDTIVLKPSTLGQWLAGLDTNGPVPE